MSCNMSPLPKSVKRSFRIEGIAASSGEVIGKVKLVFSNEELSKVEQGDIIVAPHTNPDMVLAMRKCAAIVTDSGGVTSHAAIISRELNIPCVTGTQNATRLLHDDMTVEVDGTHGTVYVLEGTISVEKVGRVTETFRIFGNEVKVFQRKMVLNKPLCRIIDYRWINPDMNKKYSWIEPRPEIHGSFVQRSLIAGGIERIPHALGFEDLSPLYVRYYCNVCICYEPIREIVRRLSVKFAECDADYWNEFFTVLPKLYRNFDEATKRFGQDIVKLDSFESEDIVNSFLEWWSVHNKFFSKTYLIQSMGDDIMGPCLTRLLLKALDKKHINESINILLAPLAEEDLVISSKFALENGLLVESALDQIRQILYSDQDEASSISTILQLENGAKWLEMLRVHAMRWWWIRIRDPYFDPISNEVGMLSFMRKYTSEVALRIDLDENRRRYDERVRRIEDKLSPIDVGRFRFFVYYGRKMAQERDNHHHIWLHNLSIVRDFFLWVGRKLSNSQLIIHEKDVFFLTLPEIIALLENPKAFERKELSKKIDKRMAHYSQVARLKLHREVNVQSTPCIDDAF